MREKMLKCIILGLVALVLAKDLGAKSPTKIDFQDSSSLLYADQISYNDPEKTIHALGSVEIHKKNLSLYCDRLSYFQRSQKVQASGHVRLIDADGNVLFFDSAELSDDLKDAFIERIRMILSDEAKLTAITAQRQGGVKSMFDKVIYSPCKICRKKEGYSPLWELEADRVLWDEQNQNIEYVDAFMKIKGVPILYTPYLSHPAPNVRRKSGFLAPSFGGGGDLGTILAVPYFWALAQDKDLTVTPMLVGSRPMLNLEYRQRFATGRLNIQTSGTYDTRAPKSQPGPRQLPDTFRGHLKVDGLYNLTDHWRTGLQIERATDQTYLRKFNILGESSCSMLISRGFMEGFYGPNYVSVEGYDFQGMREQDINSQIPMILPMIETKLKSKPQWNNSFWTLDQHFSAIHRRIGSDVTKSITTGGWAWPTTTSLGHLITTEAKIRGDLYSYSDAPMITHPDRLENGTKARFFPYLTSLIEWPFGRHDKNTRLVIEPMTSVVLSPMARTEDHFPNEDSRVIELNDVNLFSQSRFAGLDRIDAGSRLNYGLNLGAFTQNYGNGSFFFGQSYSFEKPTHFLEGTGMDKQVTDYVARLKMVYSDWLDVSSRALLDRSTFNSNRQELATNIGKPVARANITYVYLPKIGFDPQDKKLEQLGVTLSSQINTQWRADVNSTRELGHNGGALSHGVGVTYADECFSLRLSADKTYYADRDISPGMTFYFRLVFKNLGDVQQGRKIS